MTQMVNVLAGTESAAANATPVCPGTGDFPPPDVLVGFPSFCLLLVWALFGQLCFLLAECSPCEKPGHVCDPDTGRCVCPPLTDGPRCGTCAVTAWDYDSVKGCKVGSTAMEHVALDAYPILDFAAVQVQHVGVGVAAVRSAHWPLSVLARI